MTEFTYDTFAEQFRALVPGFDRVYDEHVGAESVGLKEAMLVLEGGMGCEDPRVQELVTVSFLGNLDPKMKASRRSGVCLVRDWKGRTGITRGSRKIDALGFNFLA
jgi:hypothetical protein